MRPQTERAWHNVKPNETTRLPREYLFLDAQATYRRKGTGSVQTWRMASACYVSARKGRKAVERLAEYRTPQALWRDVTASARQDGRTVMWAHNLGQQARITGVFKWLPQLDWKLVGHNITPRGTWLEWRREKATLCMTDTFSIFPATLATIGAWFGLGKSRMLTDTDDMTAWRKRSQHNLEIIKTAVTAYLDWIESEDLGNWQITGPGQSWAAFRHKFLTHKLTVHDDEQALAAERRAMWAGRCEAYWHGELKTESVHEFDFTRAYARIARDYSVPTRLMGPMPRGYNWRQIANSRTVALLAECEIRTTVPVVPTYHEGRIIWPTGTFHTVLWDVEIWAALQEGAEVTVTQGWLYRKSPALKSWAEWLFNRLDATEAEVPAWQKSVLKHWSRALIGRLAMTYQNWEEYAESPTLGVSRAQVYDRDTGELFDMMQVGHDIFRETGRVEWQNSMPMITGYVQAIARVHLWEVLSALPPRTAIYADTDSILCTDAGLPHLEKVAREYGKADLRPKRTWRGFAVYGPRQIVTGERVRVSGVPITAVQLDKRVFLGEVSDSLASALRKGALNEVITKGRKWHVHGSDHRRKGSGFGWTEPHHIDITE